MSQGRSTQTAQTPQRWTAPVASIHHIEADGVRVFYRAAGDPAFPVILLLHGFPSSSFMFRELIPRLAGDYRVIAPDLPGFRIHRRSGRTKIHLFVRSIGRPGS